MTSYHIFLTKENASSGTDGMISVQKTSLYQFSSNLITNSILFHRNKHWYGKNTLFVYFGIELEGIIDVFHFRDFEYSTHNNLHLLPPSKAGLAAYVGGWVAFQYVENVDLPCPLEHERSD